MKRVYLDTNHWIGLARALDGEPGRYGEALEVIAYAVDHDLASFPISSMHYVELNRKGDPAARQQVGAAVAAISKFHTIADLAAVLRWELDCALSNLLVLPAPAPLRVFAQGAAHAFGQPEGAFRPTLNCDVLSRVRDQGSQWIVDQLTEAALICGPPFRLPAEGIARPDPQFGRRFAADAQALAGQLDEWGRTDDHAERIAIWSEYCDLRDDLLERLARVGVDPESFFSAGGDFLRDFLSCLPVRWTGCQLRRVAFRAGQRWNPNDLDDIGHLSLAAVHCDIVVFEKHWSDRYAQAKLTDRALVLDNIDDLPLALVA